MTVRATLARLAVLAIAFAVQPSRPAAAQDAIPAQHAFARASAAFTPAFAASLRELRRFEDIEAAAGATGSIVGRSEESDGPHVVYGWTGAGGRGTMRVYRYDSG